MEDVTLMSLISPMYLRSQEINDNVKKYHLFEFRYSVYKDTMSQIAVKRQMVDAFMQYIEFMRDQIIHHRQTSQVTDENIRNKFIRISWLVQDFMDLDYIKNSSIPDLVDTGCMKTRKLQLRFWTEYINMKHLKFSTMLELDRLKNIIRTPVIELYNMCKAVTPQIHDYMTRLMNGVGYNDDSANETDEST